MNFYRSLSGEWNEEGFADIWSFVWCINCAGENWISVHGNDEWVNPHHLNAIYFNCMSWMAEINKIFGWKLNKGLKTFYCGAFKRVKEK